MRNLLKTKNANSRPARSGRRWTSLLNVATWLIIGAAAFHIFRTVSPSIDLSRQMGPAPDFTLVDMQGQPFRLSDHKGKVVVLNFWATWCPPCRAEIPGFIDIQRDLAGDGVLFVGIALDDGGWNAVTPFANARGINYPVVLGNGATARRYGGITALPTTLILDRNHTIRYVHEGLILEHSLRKALVELTAEQAHATPTGRSRNLTSLATPRN